MTGSESGAKPKCARSGYGAGVANVRSIQHNLQRVLVPVNEPEERVVTFLDPCDLIANLDG